MYNIFLTNGSLLTALQDQVLNTSATSLTLIGYNASDYGTALNDNFVHLLENSANVTPPAKPLTGQLWFNTSSKTMAVYNGQAWVSLANGGGGNVFSVLGYAGSVTLAEMVLGGVAPSASPIFIGKPTAPTPATGDSSNAIATTQYVTNRLASFTTGVLSVAGYSGAVTTSQLAGAGLATRSYVDASIANLLVSLQANLSLNFFFSGKPAAGGIYNIVIAQALTVPASLTGSTVYVASPAASTATFTLNKISGSQTTAIGTITVNAATNASATLTAANAVSLAPGDVLQLVAPSAQDNTLANISVTILASLGGSAPVVGSNSGTTVTTTATMNPLLRWISNPADLTSPAALPSPVFSFDTTNTIVTSTNLPNGYTGGIRAAQAFATGKYYFEVTGPAYPEWACGITDGRADPICGMNPLVYTDGGGTVGVNINAASTAPANVQSVLGIGTITPASPAATITFGVAVDVDNQLIWFTADGKTWNGGQTINSSFQGYTPSVAPNPSTGTSGLPYGAYYSKEVFPVLTLFGQYTAQQSPHTAYATTFNFGAAAFTFTRPTGFSKCTTSAAVQTNLLTTQQALSYAASGTAVAVYPCVTMSATQNAPSQCTFNFGGPFTLGAPYGFSPCPSSLAIDLSSAYPAGSGFSLSNGNVTVSNSALASGAYASVKSTASFATGKYYFEANLTGSGEIIIGLTQGQTGADGMALLASFDSLSGALSANAGVVAHCTVPYSVDQPTVVGVAFDASAQLIWFTLDGVIYNNGIGVTPLVTPSSGPVTATTLNPTVIMPPSLASSITISNGNLTVSQATNTSTEQEVTLRSTASFALGKYYFEAAISGVAAVGVSDGTFDAVTFTGTNIVGEFNPNALIGANGVVYLNGASTSVSISNPPSTLNVGVAFDATSRQVWFTADGQNWLGAAGASSPNPVSESGGLVYSSTTASAATFPMVGLGNYIVPYTGGAQSGGFTPASLLAYLKSIAGTKTIMGQFIELGSNSNPALGYNAIVTIQQNTGKWLGMLGFDYWYFGSTDYTPTTSANQYVIPYYDLGGLATASFSMPNPTTGGNVQDTSTLDAAGIITSGTQTNTNFLTMLDGIAVGLQAFGNRVVIVRPLHESNGSWFWWGTKTMTDAQFVALWQYTHNYLVNVKGLSNLLFCYAANAGISSMPIATRYPGDAYVDIMGLDLYTSDPTQGVSDYNTLMTYNKPVVLSEFGSGGGAGGDTSFDERVLINDISSVMPDIAYVLQWWDGNGNLPGWGMAECQYVSQALSLPRVITRGSGITATSINSDCTLNFGGSQFQFTPPSGFQPCAASSAVPGASTGSVSTTLNPASAVLVSGDNSKVTPFTFSNNNLTLSSSLIDAQSTGAVRTINSYSSGFYYFEVTWTQTNVGPLVGLTDGTATGSYGMRILAGMDTSGQLWYNSGFATQAGGAQWKMPVPNDALAGPITVGVAFDATNRYVWFSIDGQSWNGFAGPANGPTTNNTGESSRNGIGWGSLTTSPVYPMLLTGDTVDNPASCVVNFTGPFVLGGPAGFGPCT